MWNIRSVRIRLQVCTYFIVYFTSLRKRCYSRHFSISQERTHVRFIFGVHVRFFFAVYRGEKNTKMNRRWLEGCILSNHSIAVFQKGLNLFSLLSRIRVEIRKKMFAYCGITCIFALLIQEWNDSELYKYSTV